MSIALLNIISWLEQKQLPCLFKKYFHVDCPGCGFQRSIIALFKGDFIESLILFPTTLALVLFFGCFFINNKFGIANKRNVLKGGLFFIFTIFTTSYLYKII